MFLKHCFWFNYFRKLKIFNFQLNHYYSNKWHDNMLIHIFDINMLIIIVLLYLIIDLIVLVFSFISTKNQFKIVII